MDTGSFKVYIETQHIYVDIAKDTETISDTSNYELERPLLEEKIQKVVGLLIYELEGKIMTKFAALRPKK